MGLPFASSRLPCSMPTLRSCRPRRRVRGLPRAFETLLKPGSLPTTSTSVFPETAEVTLPPKLSIIFLVRALPSSRPAPPPISGNTPVSTNVCPARLPAGAPLPGVGIENCLRSGSVTSSVLVAALAAVPSCGGAARAPSSSSSAVAAAGFFRTRSTSPPNVQWLLSMTWRTTCLLSLLGRSSMPLRATWFICCRALSNFAWSRHFLGSGRPSQILLGTRQQQRWQNMP
mmetsp:Transcript_93723/g.244131  ORF Transcript_93723/g.244131 Transcript_93723/m.244131 type:complete len:229 (+) Transcript_93723:138-824(+)